MKTTLHVKLLGTPSVVLDGTAITRFGSSKTAALFYYLAITGRDHSREALAGLLWGDVDEAQALKNLRDAVLRLRQKIDAFLTVSRRTLGLNHTQSNLTIDVRLFDEYVQLSQQAASPQSTLIAQREAIALYHGDLLDGFYLRAAPAFDEWLLVERERLRQLALYAVHNLAMMALERAAYFEGIDYVTRLLALDSWREEAHRLLMQLLVKSGQPGAALAHFDAYTRRLQAELRVAPEDETLALYEQIRNAQFPPAPPVSESQPRALHASPVSNLPPQLTTFVGRDDELAQLAAWMQNPDCRLVTICGPGGAGKTRLAINAAVEQAHHFPDGVFYIDLAPVGDVAQVAATLAAALGLSGIASQDLKAQVLAFLHPRCALLLFDNFEHLSEGSDLLTEILAYAPHVQLLVTSRERLNIQAEWVLGLEGMPYSSFDPGYQLVEDTRFRKPLPSNQDLKRYAAIELFVRRARRVQPEFELNSATTLPLLRICALTEGLPLALELAASWLRVMSCAAIADELERNIDLLNTRLRDIPARHRSMRAVFDQSWRLLQAEERELLRRLAVFRGGCTLEAVIAVCWLQQPQPPNERVRVLALLMSLVDKSLLRTRNDERYDLHELVRQYAQEQLDADQDIARAVQQAHTHYYAYWLGQQAALLVSPKQREAQHQARREIDNLRASWRHACAAGNWAALDAALDGLTLLYDAYNYFQEGHEFCVLACTATPDDLRLQARLAARQGYFCERLGRYDEGIAVLENAVQLLRVREQPDELAFALLTLGRIAEDQGRLEQAQRLHSESIAIYRAQGNQRGIARALHNLSSTLESLGQYLEAERLARESLALSRAIGDLRSAALTLNVLGVILEMRHELASALDCYQQALKSFAELENRWGQIMVLGNIGDVLATTDDPLKALRHYQQALRIAHDLWDVPQMLMQLVKIALMLVRYAPAETVLTLLALPLHNESTSHAFRSQALQLCDQLRQQLGNAAVDAILAQAGASSLDITVKMVLAPAFAQQLSLAESLPILPRRAVAQSQ